MANEFCTMSWNILLFFFEGFPKRFFETPCTSNITCIMYLAFSNTETRIKTRRCLELICFAPVHVMQKTTCRWKANTGVSQIRYNEALRLFPGQAHQRSSMLFLAAALLIKSLKFRTWVLVILPILSKPESKNFNYISKTAYCLALNQTKKTNY